MWRPRARRRQRCCGCRRRHRNVVPAIAGSAGDTASSTPGCNYRPITLAVCLAHDGHRQSLALRILSPCSALPNYKPCSRTSPIRPWAVTTPPAAGYLPSPPPSSAELVVAYRSHSGPGMLPERAGALSPPPADGPPQGARLQSHPRCAHTCLAAAPGSVRCRAGMRSSPQRTAVSRSTAGRVRPAAQEHPSRPVAPSARGQGRPWSPEIAGYAR
jgi:hypothetical protein